MTRVSVWHHKRLAFRLGVAWAVVLLVTCCVANPTTDSVTLDSGYRQMYNLDFAGAHATFEAWERSHPQDPMGPVSNAAAYLFSEFDRLHVLESELFTDDQKFAERQKLEANPQIEAAFKNELNRSEQMAGQVLTRSPNDLTARFAKVMASGLRGDYLALIEKRNLAALSSMKSARALAEQLLGRDPSFYDAYLAVGAENYLLGTTSVPVRWLLRLGGAQTDKEEGIAMLRLTAEKGRYLAPYAQVLLAVAALRDRDRVRARFLLEGLASEFPGNSLYQKELSRLQP